MAIIKLCNPILDTSPTALLDRLERLERTFKYSVQIPQSTQTTPKKEQQAEPKQSKQAKEVPVTEPVVEQVSDDEIPLDIPPQSNDDMYEPTEEAAFEPAKPEIKAEQQQSALPVFEAWQDVLAELVKTAPLMAASLNGSTAYLSDDIILIDSQNDQFFSLVRSDPIYRSQIKQAVQSVVGRTYRLGPYKKKVQETGDPLKDIMNKLKSLEVPQ
jgi:DNA polymerase-3 subunit gamma/tau